jgi:hypothetical protein
VTGAAVQTRFVLCFSTRKGTPSTMVSLCSYKEKPGLKNKLKCGAHTSL